MGLMKQLWIEHQEEKYEEGLTQWIRDQLGDQNANETHPKWNELAEIYGDPNADRYDYNDFYYEEVKGKTSLDLYRESITSVTEMLKSDITQLAKRHLHVMLYAHVVASVERYLSSTFISKTLSSPKNIRALVESDPEFASRSFTLKEIFSKQAGLANEVEKYLKDLIFHRLEKVKPMYQSVFGIEFNDISWLYRAVKIRHDCVHRAGYDKEGVAIDISEETINLLIGKCNEFIFRIDARFAELALAGDLNFEEDPF